jgi:hypothetical protein
MNPNVLFIFVAASRARAADSRFEINVAFARDAAMI